MFKCGENRFAQETELRPGSLPSGGNAGDGYDFSMSGAWDGRWEGGAGRATHAGGASPGRTPSAQIARRARQDPGYPGAKELRSHHGGPWSAGHPRGGLRAHRTTTAAAGAARGLRCVHIWDVRGCVVRLTGHEEVAEGTYSLSVSLTPQQLRATLRPGMPQQPTARTTRGPAPAKARKGPNIWSAGGLMGHSVPRPPGAGWCAAPKRSRGAALMRAARHAPRKADRARTPAITSKRLRLYRRARQLAAGTLRNTPRNLVNASSRAIPPAGRHRLHSELGHSDSVTYLYWGGPPG
jgi:hypothetical protein